MHCAGKSGGRGEMASATEIGSDINLVIAWGRLESAVQFLKTSHVPKTYE